MAIGNLRKKVTLQQEQRTPDSGGGYTLAWATVATVWAAITPMSGHEITAASGIQGRLTHKITMRWRNDIPLNAGMRLLYGTRAFNIRYVLNAREANRWAIMLAEEGGAI